MGETRAALVLEDDMKIKKVSICGTLESSDVLVTVCPNEGNGIAIELDSVVQTIFGDAILETVKTVLNEFDIKDAQVRLVDKGALDCVIRARMQGAILRASEETYDWAKEDEVWQTV